MSTCKMTPIPLIWLNKKIQQLVLFWLQWSMAAIPNLIQCLLGVGIAVFWFNSGNSWKYMISCYGDDSTILTAIDPTCNWLFHQLFDTEFLTTFMAGPSVAILDNVRWSASFDGTSTGRVSPLTSRTCAAPVQPVLLGKLQSQEDKPTYTLFLAATQCKLWQWTFWVHSLRCLQGIDTFWLPLTISRGGPKPMPSIIRKPLLWLKSSLMRCSCASHPDHSFTVIRERLNWCQMSAPCWVFTRVEPRHITLSVIV